MEASFKSHCPFSDPPKPQATTGLPGLMEFVRNDGFICPIGTLLAKANAIKQTVLTRLLPGGNFIHQLKNGVAEFTKRGTGAWIIQFPKEPADYAQLLKMKTQICAHFLCTVMLQGVWDKTSRILEHAAANKDKYTGEKLPVIEEPTALDPRIFVSLLAEYIAPRLSTASSNFEKVLCSFAE